MKIQYIGKKRGLHLTFPWLKAPVMMVPKKPVDVDDDDGRRLTNDYPETFVVYQEDPLEKFIAENTPAESFEEDEAPGQDVPATTEVSTNDDIEFEVENGKYLCPFCEKTYAATEAGKPWMIKHLEKDHAEAWAKALADKKRELQGG